MRALVALERLIDVRTAAIFGQALLSGQKPNRCQVMRRVRLVDRCDQGRLAKQAIVLVVIEYSSLLMHGVLLVGGAA